MAKFGDRSHLLKCSFCGRSQKPGTKLIAGSDVYICNQCVGLCNDIIDEQRITETLRRASPGSPQPSEQSSGLDEADLTPIPVALRMIQGQLRELSQQVAELVQRVERQDKS